MTRHSAIILDVDGTLVDSNDAHARAWVEAFGEAGIAVDAGCVRRAIGMGGDKLMPHVSGLSEESEIGARISERRADIFKSRHLPHVQAFPRVRELIEHLAQDGHTIVVASSAKKDELEALLEIAGIADLIEARTSSDDAEESKPDPDIVAAALRQSGVPARAAVMLGDTPYDVEAARRTGIRIIGLECGGWSREDLQGAEEVYASPAHLLARYDRSVVARPQQEAADAGEEGRMLPAARRPPAWMLAAPLIALGFVLILHELVRIRQRHEATDSGPRTPGHPGPGPRERAELRALISRTS